MRSHRWAAWSFLGAAVAFVVVGITSRQAAFYALAAVFIVLGAARLGASRRSDDGR